MEIILYIYLAINFMLIGSYLLNVFNDDKMKVKVLISVLLFFFGGILVVWELTFAKRFEKWFNNSELKFYLGLYVLKKYDNLSKEQIEYIEKQIPTYKAQAQKENKDEKIVKHLLKILKRNGK